MANRARDRGARRDVCGDQELPDAAGDELVVEWRTVHPDLQERAHDVLARVQRAGTPPGDELAEYPVEVEVLLLGDLGPLMELGRLESFAVIVEIAGLAPQRSR